jgi:Nucleotide modification associated domain 2
MARIKESKLNSSKQLRTEMNNIYFYKLTADSGGAPCVWRGLLSLAICKPMIRKMAHKNDLIFGFAANSLHKDKRNRLIYVAYVTKKAGREYYKSYAKRPDSIYRLSGGRFAWKSDAAYHGPNDLKHDLGTYPSYERASVLLSRSFRYFGRAGTDEYKYRFPRIKRAVERLGRGARVHHNEELRRELIEMAEWIFRTTPDDFKGSPTSPPSRNVCLRGGSCGVAKPR